MDMITTVRNKKRISAWIAAIAGAVLLIVLMERLFDDRRYRLISTVFAFLACVPFYVTYEKREGSIRRMVLIAVMTAIAVAGRLVFAALPAFKPLAAVAVLSAIYMGSEFGFLVGSLSAVVSNIFFGQGPWTPFQMMALGLIGLVAGLPAFRSLLRRRVPLAVYGVLAGISYSLIMDIWTVLSLAGGWRWDIYIAKLVTAVPYTATYAVSNVFFLELMLKPVGEKLNRIQTKHGIF